MIKQKDNMSELNNFESSDMKKSIAYLILSIFVIVMIVGLYSFKERYLKSYSLINNNDNAKIADLIDIDSYESVRDGGGDDNGDGLSNWREMIYGSSAAGVSTNLSRDEDNIIISSSTNLTELLSRDLYVAAEYNKSNSNISATSLVNAIDKNYSNLLKPSEAITLNVISNPTFEEYREYGNSMGLIFYAVLGDPVTTELEEFADENSTFANTKDKIKGVSKFCTASKTIKVPIKMQSAHLDLISNCFLYVNVLNAFTNNANDPYKALIAVPEHQRVISALVVNSQYFKKEFESAKYKYSAKEYGNFFNIIN